MGILHAVYGAGATCAPLVSTQFAQLHRWSFGYLVHVGLALMSAAGCAGGKSVLEQAEVDRTILTSSSPAAAPDPAASSDAMTIRNAVSSANLDMLGAEPLAWANADTGSHGRITAIAGRQEGGVACRSFTVSRQAFDGIAMYWGDACLGQGGQWLMKAFES